MSTEVTYPDVHRGDLPRCLRDVEPEPFASETVPGIGGVQRPSILEQCLESGLVLVTGQLVSIVQQWPAIAGREEVKRQNGMPCFS